MNIVFLALYQPGDFQCFLRDMKIFECLDIEPERVAHIFADEEAALVLIG